MEAPVPQQQHARADRRAAGARAAGASPPRKGRSTTSHTTCVPVSMSATTRSWGNAPGPAAGRRAPERPRIRRRVGHVQRRAVDRHQPQPAQEGARRPARRDRAGHGVEQLPEQPHARPAGAPARWPPCSAAATGPDPAPRRLRPAPPAAPAPRASRRPPRQDVAHRLAPPTAPSPPPGSPPGASAAAGAAAPASRSLDRVLHRRVRQRRLQGLQQGPVPQPRRPHRHVPRPPAQLIATLPINLTGKTTSSHANLLVLGPSPSSIGTIWPTRAVSGLAWSSLTDSVWSPANPERAGREPDQWGIDAAV